jgi:hypothetical protein
MAGLKVYGIVVVVYSQGRLKVYSVVVVVYSQGRAEGV